MPVDFKNAINDKVNKLTNLSTNEKLECDNLEHIIDSLQDAREHRASTYYFEHIPAQVLNQVLTGMHAFSSWDMPVTINRVFEKESSLLASCDIEMPKRVTKANIYLKTIATEWTIPYKYKKYFNKITTMKDYDSIIARLSEKLDTYKAREEELLSDADKTINSKLNQYKSNIVINREAIKRAVFETKNGIEEIDKSFKSGLSKDEQETLLTWIKQNVFVMHLYVVKGSRWDQAVTELYPEETYGKIRRTEPSESSTDSISGYISFISKDNAPVDIFHKVVQRGKGDLVSAGNKYRINNTMLVLWLLSNYNKDGFKLSVHNLRYYLAV